MVVSACFGVAAAVVEDKVQVQVRWIFAKKRGKQTPNELDLCMYVALWALTHILQSLVAIAGAGDDFVTQRRTQQTSKTHDGAVC